MKISKGFEKITSKIVALSLALAIATPIVSGAQEEVEKNIEFFNATKNYILKNYAGDEVSEQELIDAAVKGMFNSLDPHSTYLGVDESEDFNEEMGGSVTGIGALIGIRNGSVTVLEPLEDSPAMKAGILPGDIIRGIDGEEIVDAGNLSEIVSRIKGEEGTSVILTIERKGRSFDVTITRAKVEINPVRYRKIGSDIGYIKLSEFSKVSIENMDEAVGALTDEGIDKLVLDLRGNPGGGLVDVVQIAQDFVPKGNIVTVEYKSGAENSYPSYGSPKFSDVAVLVDSGSASASEILAGAIQDTDSGVLIGESTYGKGTVQKLLPLKNGEAIKLTIAKYVLPSGRSIDHTGLVPDVQAERFAQSAVNMDEISSLQTDHAMREGDAGLDVLALQERLRLLGYGISDARGIYGQSTRLAVENYQRDSGLYPYGVADNTTLSSIGSDFSKFMLSDEMDNQLQKAIEYLEGK